MLICDDGSCSIFVFQVLNVQVPFLFKLAVDSLNTATGNAAAGALASNPTMMALFGTPVAVLIGYGIARSGASAFNGMINEVIAMQYLFCLTVEAGRSSILSQLNW